MSNFRNTLQILFFIIVLLPFWIADICYLGCVILRLLPSLPNSVINFLWYFALGYLPICIVLIIIGLIADIIIYAVKKSREK